MCHLDHIYFCLLSSYQGDFQSKWGLEELRIKFQPALYVAALRGGKLVRLSLASSLTLVSFPLTSVRWR